MSLVASKHSGLRPRFWILVLLTGAGAGIGAGLLMKLLRLVQHLGYQYRSGTFLDAVSQVSAGHRVLLMVGAGGMAAFGNWALRHSPGDNAGELNQRIWFHSGRLPEFKTLLKAALSITIVGMGTSLGRETAAKQAGAAIGSRLSRIGRLSPVEARFLVACGTGAGMGAIYNIPLGGALFALEALLGTVALPLIPPALAASLLATIVSWSMLPNRATYLIGTFPISANAAIWAAIFGPVAGLVAVAYTRFVIVADSHKPKRGWAQAAPVLALGMVGVVGLWFPQVLGNGKDVVQLALDGAVALPLLLVLVLLKPLATLACLGSGAPGGLFTPTITLGALLGGVAGAAWSWAWPGAPPGGFALIGGIAVLAACMQAPITAIVLAAELTRHFDAFMIPVMLAVAGATLTARLIDPRSIYTGRVHAGRAMAGGTPVPLSAAATYPEVLARLLSMQPSGAPIVVVNETGRAVGHIGPDILTRVDRLTVEVSVGAAADLMTTSV